MSKILDKIKDSIEIVLGVTVIVVVIISFVVYNKGKKAASCPTGQTCRSSCPTTRPCPTGTTGSTGGASTSPANTSLNSFKPGKLVTVKFPQNGVLYEPQAYFSCVLTYDDSNNKIITWGCQKHNFTFAAGRSAGDINSLGNDEIKTFLSADVIGYIDYNRAGFNPNTETDNNKKVKIGFYKSDGRVRFFSESGDTISTASYNSLQFNGPFGGTISMNGNFTRPATNGGWPS